MNQLPQINFPQNFYGYADVLDIAHPIPITMDQIAANPPMFIALNVNYNNMPNIIKLTNLNQFLINGQLPENLVDLKCDNNSLTTLPTLNDGLEYLSCNYNIINNLPQLPNSLQYLFCHNNKLTSLNIILPTELIVLNCNNNQLVSLPPLNNLENLIHLECSNNNLTELPALPNNDIGLSVLNCSYNKLHVLPDLPFNLIKLNCSYNLLNGLPNLTNNIQKLNISNNPIIGSIASITLPTSLKYFYCFNCQINDLPSILPIQLKEFDCANNSINSLPNLPIRLKKLDCSNNKLTFLPDLPTSLRVLYCKGNNFDDLTINKIIAFYKNAIANKFRQTIPTYQQQLDYYQINRSKTFINAFGQYPQDSKGQMVSVSPGLANKPKSIPSNAMKKILESANLPLPPGKLGGTKKRLVKKKNLRFLKKKTKTCKKKTKT